MTKTELASQIKAVSLLSGSFKLRSGVSSKRYFDKYLFEAEPRLLVEIAAQMEDLLPADIEVLAGLEMGGIPLVTALSLRTGLPSAYLRKEAKTYGTCKYAEGAALVGKRVVLVEDVVSSGGAILDVLQKLRVDGIEPIAAICLIDRGTGGKEKLAAVGLELRSVYTMDDIDKSSN